MRTLLPLPPTPLSAIILGCACTLVTLPTQAASFDFESVAPPPFTGTVVPAGYAGADWADFVLRRTNEFTGGSNGFVLNGTTMALAEGGTPTLRFATPTVFDGAFIGSNAVGHASTIGYTLWLGAAQVADSGPLGFNASFLSSVYLGAIDRIVFHVTSGDRLSLDSVAISTPVPEPATWALWAGGLLGLAARRWARRPERS